MEWGDYEVGAPRCASTDAAPAYPAANYRAALFDFAGLTAHRLAVGRHDLVETYTDPDCTLTVRRGLHTNLDGRFSARKDRRYEFAPPGCELAVEVAGESHAVGSAYTTLFTDSDDLTEELPYEVSADADGYELTTVDDPVVSALWGPFGCAAPDRLRIRLAASTK